MLVPFRQMWCLSEPNINGFFLSSLILQIRINRLSPKNLFVYGGKVDYDYKNINVVYYSNSVTERMNSWEAEEQV